MPDSTQVRPGSWFTFRLKIHRTQTALQKPNRNRVQTYFMHYIFWILMPDKNQVSLGTTFIFILKIHKMQTVLQKTR